MILTYGYSFATHGIGVDVARAWFSGDSPAEAVPLPDPYRARVPDATDTRMRIPAHSESRMRIPAGPSDERYRRVSPNVL